MKSQKSKKGSQIARLSNQIKNLTLQTIKSKSSVVTEANVTSKRVPAKRKRKFCSNGREVRNDGVQGLRGIVSCVNLSSNARHA